MKERIITQQEEEAFRHCHHDFGGLSIKAAACRMGVTIGAVRKYLQHIKQNAPQLFPILTPRDRTILAMYDLQISRVEIAELLRITWDILDERVKTLRKHGFLWNRKPDQFDPGMDAAVKEKF